MRIEYKNYFLVFVAIFAFVACSSESEKQDHNNSQPAATTMTEPAASQGPVSLKILFPKEGEVLHDTNVGLKFDLKNYEIKPNGQHIHIIVDNEPYQPCYDLSTPFVIMDLKPGIHTIRAFPARAWHESIKDPDAFASVTFYVEKKRGKAPVNFEKDKILTYSRPKGKYEGDKAKKIIFDFWLKNVTLSPDGYKVRYTLDKNPPQLVTEWKPQFFENLAAGKHQLTIELLNKKNRPVKGAYNKTTREFEVAP